MTTNDGSKLALILSVLLSLLTAVFAVSSARYRHACSQAWKQIVSNAVYLVYTSAAYRKVRTAADETAEVKLFIEQQGMRLHSELEPQLKRLLQGCQELDELLRSKMTDKTKRSIAEGAVPPDAPHPK